MLGLLLTMISGHAAFETSLYAQQPITGPSAIVDDHPADENNRNNHYDVAALLLQRLVDGEDEDEGRQWQIRLQKIQEANDMSPSEQIEAAMAMLMAASKGIEVIGLDFVSSIVYYITPVCTKYNEKGVLVA